MDDHQFPAMLGSGFNTYDVCANVRKYACITCDIKLCSFEYVVWYRHW